MYMYVADLKLFISIWIRIRILPARSLRIGIQIWIRLFRSSCIRIQILFVSSYRSFSDLTIFLKFFVTFCTYFVTKVDMYKVKPICVQIEPIKPTMVYFSLLLYSRGLLLNTRNSFGFGSDLSGHYGSGSGLTYQLISDLDPDR